MNVFRHLKKNLKQYLTKAKLHKKKKIVNAIFGEEGLLRSKDTPLFYANVELFKRKFKKFGETKYADGFLKKVMTNVFNPSLVSGGLIRLDYREVYTNYRDKESKRERERERERE